jgi:transposase
LSAPNLRSWQADGSEIHLHSKAKTAANGDGDGATAKNEPQAICCYSLSLEPKKVSSSSSAAAAGESEKAKGQMWLRFVEGQAVSGRTIAYLEWVSKSLAESGEKVLVMIWDNAKWHCSKLVRNWFKSHNQKARAGQKAGQAAVRIIPCYLPVKSPWLNAIEPRWLHGKRAVVEPERKLSGKELIERVCNYFDCPILPFISKQVA